MDPPLINESSFSAANPSAYSLAEIWPFPINAGSDPTAVTGGGLGLRIGNLGGFGETSGLRDGSMEESTVTEQSVGCGGGRKRKELSSEDESSKIVSTTTSANELVGFFLFSCWFRIRTIVLIFFFFLRFSVAW